MRICYIYNPNSGGNRRNPAILRELLRRTSGDSAVLRVTERPLHGTQLAREAVHAGFDRIVAVGGDGTMNEVAQALVGTGVPLGLVPCGSGNGLALHLGIPLGPLDALALAGDPGACIKTMDTGLADGHPFFNAMGVGLDAEISLRFNRLTRRGLPSYVRTTLGAFLSHRSTPYTVTDELGSSRPLRAMIVAVANSDQYGNKAYIAPKARVDDGRLNLVAISPMNPLRLATLVYRLFAGTLDRSRAVTSLLGASFVIERPSPGPLHTDGETHEAGTHITVAVRPASLRILILKPST